MEKTCVLEWGAFDDAAKMVPLAELLFQNWNKPPSGPV
jgi:hypothetical protein